MRLALEVKMDGAAFEVEDSPRRADGYAVGEVLRGLAGRINGPLDLGDQGDLRDPNGNTCGRWRVFKQ